ncbi:MAG: dihydrofolate reductase family protein [Jatrophihabitantaceae bacterium]
MRALLPLSPAVDLHAWYARDWLDRGGLRVNFVSSADGAVTADGVSAGLQTPGDNLIFAALRDLADVLLVGAGTVRTEGYEAVRLGDRRTAMRLEYGLNPQLPTAVVSRSLRLDPAAALFTEAPPDARTIVLTCAAADAAIRAALERVADVVVCGDEDVDLPAARGELTGRGLTRILSEGGPTLFGDLARTGVVDEVCLSLSPLLAGPGARRIVAGELWTGGPRDLDLVGLLEEDGALFLRYRVRSQSHDRSSDPVA